MKSAAIFTLFCFLTSCTITKRVHNPGWHLEWKNTLSAEKNQSAQDEKTCAEQAELNERVQVHNGEEQLTAEVLSPEQADVNKVENNDALAKTDGVKSSESTGHKSLSEKLNTIDRDAKTQFTSEKKRGELHTLPLHPNLKVSLLSAITVLLCYLLFHPSIFILFCSLALIFSILTIVFAVKGMRAVKRAPETWKGRILAVFLIVIGILDFCFSLLLGLLLLSYFGFL